MSPRPTAPDVKLCAADHSTLDEKTLCAHYSRGCRDTHTRAANSRRESARLARKKAEAAPGGTTPQKSDTRTAGTDTTRPKSDTRTAGTETEPPRPTPAPPAEAAAMDARGAIRRLQALPRLGYLPEDLAEQTGLSIGSIACLMFYPPVRIKVRAHAAIAKAYRQLKTQPREATGAHQVAVTRAWALADLYDWPGPFEWEDVDSDPKPAHKGRSHRDAGMLERALAEHEIDTPGGDDDPAQSSAFADITIAALREELTARETEIASLTVRLEEEQKRGDRLAHRLDEATATLAAGVITTPATAERIADEEQQLQADLDEARKRLEQRDDMNAQQGRVVIDLLAKLSDTEKDRDRARALAINLEAELAWAGDRDTERIQHLEAENERLVSSRVEKIEAVAVEGELMGRALAAEVEITIEPTDAGGLRIAFPESLLRGGRD